jgi:neutral trehalase
MPLYICIATEERANRMKNVAVENFKYKMPTVPFDRPEYSNDYWRGPTWLNVAYFAAKGLRNYGFDMADKIKESILDMCHSEKRGIFENYDSVTGRGLCCDHFSWSCVFINEFILNF